MLKVAGLAPILLCAAVLVAQTLVAQTSAPPSPAPTNPALTNADVIKMVKGGLQESTILGVIATADCDFDVSVDGLLVLKEAGISDQVMNAMLSAVAKKRATASSSSVSPAASSSVSSAASSPRVFSTTPSQGTMVAGAPMSQQMAALTGQMGGMMPPSELPKINLLVGSDKKPMVSSIAQMAQNQTKGSSGSGAATGSLLRAFIAEGLSFAGPASGIASGVMGGMGHHGPPTTTYIWALPGHTSSYVMPTTRPKFDLEFGNIAGLDPDRYEPVLVHLPQTKDNYRLVGATRQQMSYMGSGQPQSMIDEERTPLQATRIERGHMQLEPASPLAPGEYGLVLRPTKIHKPKKGESQSGAQQGVFYAVWDFSIAGQTADPAPPKKK